MFKKYDQKDIKIDGWRVYDLPIRHTEDNYEEAREEIVNKAKITPGLVALFEVGYIPALGISDMDFWAVFADDAKTMYIPSEPIFSKKTEYLMFHRIMVIPEKYYHKMLYFDPWTTNIWPDGHRLLWQRDDIKRNLNFEKINFTPEEKRVLDATYIEEMLGLVHPIISLYANKELPARRILETIKDCIYIAREVNILSDRKIDPIFSNFSNELRSLQNQWFDLDLEKAVKKLIDLLYQGLIISFEASFSLADWIGKNSNLIAVNDLRINKTNFRNQSYLDKKTKNIYLDTFKNRRVFTDLVETPEDALRLSVNSYKKIKMNLGWQIKTIDFCVIFQPFEMAGILLNLVDQNGLLSNNLKKDIFTNQEEVPVLQSQILQTRSEMVNEITEIYNKKQRSNSYGKGFVYGNHRYDYQFEKESLKRRFLNLYLRRRFWRTINKKLIQ